jgi:pyruvate ferredoxin oxidoreductase beta subunit
MHGAKYVATANIAYWNDLQNKVKKAKSITGGTRFIHVYSPCPVGWHVESQNTIKVAKLAVETGLWILYEIENGELKINLKPKGIEELKFTPVEEYFKLQGRFKHILNNKEAIEFVENHIKETWNEMLRIEKEKINLLKLI